MLYEGPVYQCTRCYFCFCHVGVPVDDEKCLKMRCTSWYVQENVKSNTSLKFLNVVSQTKLLEGLMRLVLSNPAISRDGIIRLIECIILNHFQYTIVMLKRLWLTLI